MRIGRTTLAFLVALSQAMLPMAGAFAVPTDEPMVSDGVAAPAHEDCDHQSIASEVVVASAHDCCDHGSMAPDHIMNECHASAGCTAGCDGIFRRGDSTADRRDGVAFCKQSIPFADG